MKQAVVSFFHRNGELVSSIDIKSPTTKKLKEYVESHRKGLELNTDEEVIIRPYQIVDITEKYKVPVNHMSYGVIEVEALDKVDLLEKLCDQDFVNTLPMPKKSVSIENTLEVDFQKLGIKKTKTKEIYILTITIVATDVFNIDTETHVANSFEEAFDKLKEIITVSRLDIELEEGQGYVNYYEDGIGSFVAEIESKVIELC